MVAIDWVKRIIGIIGSLGYLVWGSLLQNRGCIHHSGDGVGAVYEGGAVQSSLAGLFSLFRSLNQTNKTDQIDQLFARRRDEMVSVFSPCPS